MYVGCVFLIDVEYDGFLVVVVVFFEEGCDFFCCQKGVVVQNQCVVEIFGVVDVVFDFVVVVVQLVFFGLVVFYVMVDVNFDDFVGSQKFVVDFLFK